MLSAKSNAEAAADSRLPSFGEVSLPAEALAKAGITPGKRGLALVHFRGTW